jgi:hypothetical protein
MAGVYKSAGMPTEWVGTATYEKSDSASGSKTLAYLTGGSGSGETAKPWGGFCSAVAGDSLTECSATTIDYG